MYSVIEIYFNAECRERANQSFTDVVRHLCTLIESTPSLIAVMLQATRRSSH